MYRQRSAVADELGTAVLRLELDTTAFKDQLRVAKSQIEGELGGAVGGTTGRRSGGTTTVARGPSTPLGDLGRLVQGARDLNLNTNWGKFLKSLEEIDYDLSLIAAGKTVNLNTSWGLALQALEEVQRDLQLIGAGEKLNINTSWGLALQTLEEVQKDLQFIGAGEKVNLNTSWGLALQTLEEIQKDLQLIGAGEKVNLNTSWGLALQTLSEINQDLVQIGAGRRLNLNQNWGQFLSDAENVREDIAQSTGGRKLNLKSSWNRFFEDAEEVRRDIIRSGKDARKQSRKNASRRRQDIISNVAIGAGFPLLFGQGAGAAAGGALGGGLGGALGGTAGFAGSIVGTALGQAFDTALQKAQTLAVGLQDPIKNFDALKEAALLSSAPLEKQVQSLIDAGRTAEAYAIIQADLAQTFGSAEGAKEYQKAVDNLNREWSIATTRLANFVAGPLADFLQKISGGAAVVTGGITQNQTAQQAAQRPLARADLAAGLTRAGSVLTLLGLTGAASGIGAVPGLGAAALGTGLVAGGQALGAQDDKAQRDAIFASIAALKERARARKLDLDIQKLSNQETLASIRGNEVEAATLKKRTAELERQRALQTNQPLVDVQRIDADIIKADAERLKAQQSLDKSLFDEFQKRQQIERSIANATQLLGTQQGVQRDALQTIQQITASITEARQKEAAIGFQIDQARVGGREEEARVLVEQQRTAAAETRQKFFEGALALRDAGESIRKNLTESVQSLQSLRLQNLQFLSPSQRADTLRQLEADVKQAAKERGFMPRFTGSRQEQLAQKAAFVDFARQERALQKAISQGNEALIKVNEALSTQFTDLNGQLAANAAATAALAQKEWVVSVNVVNQAGGSSTVNTLNGLS